MFYILMSCRKISKKTRWFLCSVGVISFLALFYFSTGLTATFFPKDFRLFQWESRDVCNDKRCFTADFNTSINVPRLCSGEVKLVIVIHVTADRFKERDIIRKTWLSDLRSKASLKNVRYFFLMGQPATDEIRQTALRESDQHRDIVMYEFLDTYRNLTLKTVLAMKWITNHCSNSKFFFKTDDDVWVNVTNLMSVAEKNKSKLKYALGGVCRSVIVDRNTAHKWHASYSEITQELYDPYCSGTGYLGGIEVAKGVAKVYKKVPYFHLEDVYVGMCLKALGYSTLYIRGFDNTSGPSRSNCNIKTSGLITLHKVPASRIEIIYNEKC